MAALLACRLLLPGRAAAGTRQRHRTTGGVRRPAERRPGDVARKDGASRPGPARGTVRRGCSARDRGPRAGRSREPPGGRFLLSDPRLHLCHEDRRGVEGRGRCIGRGAGPDVFHVFWAMVAAGLGDLETAAALFALALPVMDELNGSDLQVADPYGVRHRRVVAGSRRCRAGDLRGSRALRRRAGASVPLGRRRRGAA